MSVFISGTIFGVIAAFAVARALLGYAPRPSHLRHLGKIDVTVIQAVGDVMFPEGGELPASARDADVVTYIDDYFSWHAPMLRTLMHLMFLLIEHGTLLFVPSLRRMSQLGEDERIAYLESWDRSRIYARRMVFQSLRAIMCMAYLHHPDVERGIGIERPQACLDKALVS